MGKLEFKHLAPYLPYKLKVQYWDRKIVMNAGQGSSKNWIGIAVIIQRQGENCNPILHPLSDLTKEIKVNGEKFVPMKFFYDSYGAGYNNYASFLSHEKINFSTPSLMRYCDVQYLLKWHFDISGLIEKELAVAYK